MTDKPLHADIVTAVMDCIEREGMISRGKLEQAVAGVLATRQDKAWTTAGDPRPRIDRNGRVMGPGVGTEQTKFAGVVTADGEVVRVPVGGDWFVSSGTREVLLRKYSHTLSPSLVLVGVPLPEVKFNHKPTDKPIDRTAYGACLVPNCPICTADKKS